MSRRKKKSGKKGRKKGEEAASMCCNTLTWPGVERTCARRREWRKGEDEVDSIKEQSDPVPSHHTISRPAASGSHREVCVYA